MPTQGKGGEPFMTQTHSRALIVEEDEAAFRAAREVPAESCRLDELERSRAEIDRLCELHREAQREVGRLREAIAARDHFIATAGHELRNPMAGLVLSVNRLRFHVRCAQDTPTWLSPLLGALDRQICNYVTRATTLLDISRLATGRLPLDRERANLSDIVAGVVEEMAMEGERSRCRIDLEMERPVEGWWDPEALKRIAMNLLSNAIKYGAGYPVAVCVSADGGSALLSVRDHGAGISQEDRNRIFERFERALSRDDHPGFGVGLWIARQLAVAHGGEILVESIPGIGSIFTAVLPRCLPEPPQ
jgi:signal transduction histidine kinase